MKTLLIPEEDLLDLGIKSSKRLQYLKGIYGLTHSADYHLYHKYYHGGLSYKPDKVSIEDISKVIEATNAVHKELEETFGAIEVKWYTRVFDTEAEPQRSTWTLIFDNDKKYAKVAVAQRKIMLDKLRSNS
jgi:hypothetical protein